jgi:hypothetical protein
VHHWQLLPAHSVHVNFLSLDDHALATGLYSSSLAVCGLVMASCRALPTVLPWEVQSIVVQTWQFHRRAFFVGVAYYNYNNISSVMYIVKRSDCP